MCGLFFSNVKNDWEGNSEKKISDFISHRGTYDPIMIEKEGMLFAHCLLPVQGKVPVFQPLIQNNNILVFSGEIWSHDPDFRQYDLSIS